jgi:5'-methylthioadenosine phosphorylase
MIYMHNPRIGIIGGSGLYQIDGISIQDEIQLYTPFGEPSDKLVLAEYEDKQVVFLPRHGGGHRILPNEINYRANIWAMKSVGVEWIISVSAVGSFKKDIRPLDIVLVDQFYDRTSQRISTFFGNGIAAHIMFAHPVCENLRRILYKTGQEHGLGPRIHWGGTYLNMEGPAFSTKGESHLYQSWGMDVIGMTNLTEAKLAREAEICYATMAMVTDYDCWIEGDSSQEVSVDMIIENLKKNVEAAKKLIKAVIPIIPEKRNCECLDALKNAIMTPVDLIPRETKEKLKPILRKYITLDKE